MSNVSSKFCFTLVDRTKINLYALIFSIYNHHFNKISADSLCEIRFFVPHKMKEENVKFIYTFIYY